MCADSLAPHRGAISFLLATIALDAVGMGVLIPVIPRLIADISGGGLDRSAVIGGWLTTLFAIVQFFAGPVLGNLSDQWGRRPVLILSLAGFGASYLLMGFAGSLVLLFVAQALAGLFGSTQGTAAAYVADVTPPEHRPRRFGAMGAAFGVGLTLGPVLGGLLVDFGTRVPFYVAAGLSLANVLLGVFVLPESLSPQHRRTFHWSRAHPIGAIREIRRHAGIGPLVAGVLVMQIVMVTLPTTWPYFTMQKLAWTSRQVGLSLGVFGVSNIIVQAGLTGLIARRFGSLIMAQLGFGAVALGYAGFAFGSGSGFVLCCIPLTVLGFVTQPALVSLMSGRIGADAQGALQGAVASTSSLAAMGTPLLMPALFGYFSQKGAPIQFPGAPYFLAALLAVFGALLIRRTDKAGPGLFVSK